MPPGSRPPRIVADTNVLFSALAFPKDTPPAQVLALARQGQIRLVGSPFILSELEQALRATTGWDEDRLVRLRKQLNAFLSVVVPRRRIHVIQRVEADNRILECAAEAKVDALVTGNMKDLRPLGLFRGIPILTPREFLDRYFPQP